MILKALKIFLSNELRFNVAKRIIANEIERKGAESHVIVRRNIYKRFLRGYPVEFSFEYGRTYGLFKTIKSIRNIEGAIVEFGVGNGRSMFTWASALKFFDIQKPIYGFDSFDGFPAAHRNDLGTRITELSGKVEGWSHIPSKDYILNFLNHFFELKL